MSKLKEDDLWDKLQKDILDNFPETYTANIQLIKDILSYKKMVHPSAVVTSYFTIVSGLTAEHFYTEQNSSTTLYTISIAPTGSGKDIGIKSVTDVFNSLNYDKGISANASNILTSKITSVGALDRIFKKNRLVIQIIDEFGDALGKMQGGGHAGELTAKFKELYSLTDGTYKSINYASSNSASNDKVVRDYPCFILSGITTKVQLLSRLKKEMLHDGFLNRFIILEGTGFKPYITHKDSSSDRKEFQDIFDFYEKVNEFENTNIPMSKIAQDYYWNVIGDPYSEGTEINIFCKENDEDFETNSSISNRWRENALRLATAITAYEFGVTNTKEDVQKFQKESLKKNELKSKLSSLTNRELNDEGTNLVNIIKEEFIVNLVGENPTKEDYEWAKEEIENRNDFKLTESLQPIFTKGLKNRPKSQRESTKEAELIDEVESSEKSLLEVELDILKWSYEFIKKESIKFYDVFHDEVEETKYSENKRKAIEWLKKNHIDTTTWHKLSDLARSSRPFKNIKSNERQILLKDLVESEILIESKNEGSTLYQYKTN